MIICTVLHCPLLDLLDLFGKIVRECELFNGASTAGYVGHLRCPDAVDKPRGLGSLRSCPGPIIVAADDSMRCGKDNILIELNRTKTREQPPPTG